MLDNLKSDIREYVEKHTEAEKLYLKARDLIEKRYAAGLVSEMHIQVKNEFLEEVTNLYKTYKEKVLQQFLDAEKSVKTRLMAPMSQDMVNTIYMLEQIDNLTPGEVKAIYEGVKGNYLASKRVFDKINRTEGRIEKAQAFEETGVLIAFKPMDDLLAELDQVRDYVLNSIFNTATSDFINATYSVRNVIEGTMIQSLKDNLDDFTGRYSA